MNRLRDASGLAEQKESEVEKLKREKRHLIWTVIYLRSFLVKYGELRQALDMAEKERQFDLKEREALVYRAEALQREFDHTNKLLQVIGDHHILGELLYPRFTDFYKLIVFLLLFFWIFIGFYVKKRHFQTKVSLRQKTCKNL